MKIQTISNYTIPNHSFFVSKKTQNNFNSVDKSKFSSIYDKTISPLSFAGTVVPTTNFSKEIAQQPKVLGKIIDGFFQEPEQISGVDIHFSKSEMNKVSAINIVASGSSKNSGEMAKSFMERIIGLPVNIYSASEFMTAKPKINKDDIMIFVSQSGNTADTFEALKFAKENNIKSIALTNNLDSKIAQNADFSIDMQAGEEKAVAATKTVTSSVVNLWGIAMKLGEIRGTFLLDSDCELPVVTEMKKLPDKIQSMLDDKYAVNKIAGKIANAENIYILAKEPNLGAVNEGALKLTETTNKRVISGSSSEFMHGLFTSMKPNDLYIQIATGYRFGKPYQMAKENFEEIVSKRDIKDSIIFKTDVNKVVEEQLDYAHFINIPDTIPMFEPLFNTIRLQQLTEGVTRYLDINPDNGGGVLTKFRSNLTMKK